MRLIVTNAFGDYKPGDEITDAQEVEAILAGDNSGNVVKTAAAPAPEPKPAKRG
jgi:hypothetical protein